MSIFRKRSLDRLSSPERLDEMLVAAAPRHWIAFAGAFAMVAAGVAWSFLGQVPTRIAAEGILLIRGSEIFSASAEGNGQLTHVRVELGQFVEKGQVVAQLRQDIDATKLVLAEAAAQRAEKRLSALETERDLDLARRRSVVAEEVNGLVAKLRNARKRLSVLNVRLDDLRALQKKGYASRANVLNLEVELIQAEAAATDLQDRRRRLENEVFSHAEAWQQKIVGQRRQLEGKREQESTLRKLLAVTQTVEAPVSGRVTEIAASLGDVVPAGAPIVRILSFTQGQGTTPDRHPGQMDALLFVSPIQGKRIARGDKVQVEPTTTKKEEFGTIVAEVTSVSALPLSPAAIRSMLHNDTLVQKFSQRDAPVVVRADLSEDRSTISGFAWTGGHGPAFAVEPGTMTRATVTIAEQRPITLILPFLKSLLGV